MLRFSLVLFALSGMLSIASAATVVRVCSLPLPPHTMQDENGKPDGYATRVLQAVAKTLHWELEFRYMPWLRVAHSSKNGECDVTYTVLKRADYEEFLIFPKEAVQHRANVLIVRRGSGITYDGNLAAFMRRYSIGLYRDKAVDNQFEQLRRSPWARVDQTDTPRQNMEKLLAGRFDSAIENSLTAVHELRAMGRLDEADILDPPLNRTDAYITFPKSGRLVDQVGIFNAALAAYKHSAEFKALDTYYRGLR